MASGQPAGRAFEVDAGKPADAEQDAAQRAAAQEAVVEAGREVVHTALRSVRQGGVEIHSYIVSNPSSVVTMSFIGGLLLVFTSAIAMLELKEVLESPLEYILNVYLFFFGLAIVAIDGPGDRLPTLRARVLNHAAFLHNNINRTLFYAFIGCIHLRKRWQDTEWWRKAVGLYFILVAVAHGALQFAGVARAGSAGGGAHPAAEAADGRAPASPAALS